MAQRKKPTTEQTWVVDIVAKNLDSGMGAGVTTELTGQELMTLDVDDLARRYAAPAFAAIRGRLRLHDPQ